MKGYVLAPNGRDCEFEDPCLNGGGCEHNCQAVGSLAVCSCYDGFELAEDNQHCSDLDECAVDNAGCSGTCVNTEGSFFCSCPPGFELGNDGFKCYRVVMELISRKPVRTFSIRVESSARNIHETIKFCTIFAMQFRYIKLEWEFDRTRPKMIKNAPRTLPLNILFQYFLSVFFVKNLA